MDTFTYRDDNELVQNYISGNVSCLEELINRHRKKIYTYIILIVKNQHLAEDIFQDTFIRVMRSLQDGRYVDNGRFLSWVLRIAHNLIIDHFRKDKQLKTISNDSCETDIFNSRTDELKPHTDAVLFQRNVRILPALRARCEPD